MIAIFLLFHPSLALSSVASRCSLILFIWYGYSNCSNLLLPFLLIIHILYSEAILLKILPYTLFPRFLWSTLLPFPSYFNLHNLTYLGIDVSTHDISIPLQMALNYQIINFYSNTNPITKVINQHPINQYHPTHHSDHMKLQPMQPPTITTVSFHISQPYNKTGLTQH